MQLIRFIFRSLLILFSLITISVPTKAQDRLSEIKIELTLADVPLKEALDIISEKSGFSFSYNPKKVPVNRKINYRATSESIEIILQKILPPLGLTHSLVENQIILRKDEKPSKGNNTISGYIKDKNSGEALIGSLVFIQELNSGTASNQYGFYSLTIPRGTYQLTYSYIGYKKEKQTFNLSSSETVNIVLSEEPPLLEGLVVTSSTPTLLEEIQLGKTNLRPSQINERAALFGENDVIKTLESVPGIKPHSDGSTFYYVRGGDRDQNLILIDDAPIYNPGHLLGLFSTVIPDAINDLSIYKGEMPASIGGRLSSVMDIRTKKGNDQHLELWGSTSPVSTKLGIEGPIKKDFSSFLLSGRLSQIGWVFRLEDKKTEKVYFGDFTGKLNFKLNQKNSIFFSLYTGVDNYLASNEGIKWTNTAGTFRWTHLFNDRLFLKTTIAGSTYDYFLNTNRSANTRWNSHISNFTLKTDFSYFLKPQNEVTFGLGLSGYNINPGNLESPDAGTPIVSVRNSAEVVLYANHEFKINQNWGLKYGLRITGWNNVGESFEFIFDENRQPIDTLFFEKGESYSTYENVEPRLALSYSINDNSSVKWSYSRNIQNLHLITNSISPFTSLEVWLPSNINIKPQASDQLGLGYYQFFPEKHYSLEIEGFYKKMTNQIDYEAHAETLLNPFIERELRFGKGTSYGIEITAKKEVGKLRGWAGYSYSRAKRKFAEINDGRTFNAFFDRPHEINLVTSYDLNRRWNIGMNYTYFTGGPISSPISFYKFNDQEIPIYGQKNNDRLPDYQRLDLSATLRLNRNKEKNFQHNLNFSIYNFFGRKNPFFINHNKTQVGEDEFRVPTNLLENTRVASQTFLFQFVPSVSYNFKWQ